MSEGLQNHLALNLSTTHTEIYFIVATSMPEVFEDVKNICDHEAFRSQGGGKGLLREKSFFSCAV